MRCITKIEYADIDREFLEVYRYNPHPIRLKNTDKFATVDTIKECINGLWFKSLDGEDVCIGWSKEAQEIIGLPFGALRNISDQLDRSVAREMQAAKVIKNLCAEKYELFKELEKIKNLSFWERIKRVFNQWT
jgi:hypothetical protein